MKNLILTLLVFLCTANVFAEGVVIKTTISLGRKSQNCDGFGICTMQVVTDSQPGEINGTITLNEAEDVMIICINTSDLTNIAPDKVAYFTNKTSVEFAEDFTLPATAKTALNTTKSLVIKKGSYTLTQNNGIYSIEISL